jgi:hypothetical protein
MDDEVEAIADTEDGNAEFEKAWIGSGRIGVVDRGGAAGEDYAKRFVGLDIAERDRAREDDGEDVQFADAASDELGILRSEVEDYDCLGVHPLVWQGERRAVNCNRKGRKRPRTKTHTGRDKPAGITRIF